MFAPRALRRCLARHQRSPLPTASQITVPPPLQSSFLSQTHPRHESNSPLDPNEIRKKLASARRNTPKDQDELRAELDERLRHARPLLSHRAASRFTNAGRSRSQRSFVLICVAAAVVFYFANSQTVPVTGRRRFNFLSDALVDRMGRRGAEEVVVEVKEQGGRFLNERDWRFQAVKRVMMRLVPVSGMTDVDWKIRVIEDDKTVNAFVTPGGYLFVFSGMLRVCGNDDALAAVLGHEIAHNVASHAAERMSAAAIANLTSGSLFFLAGALPGLALFGIWSVTGGRYLQDLLFSLPMGRKMETEADHIGLMMMAEACYDPREAVTYWQKMARLAGRGGMEVPEMLSTHPSNDNRIEKMRQWLPEALDKRQQSDCMGGAGAWADQFRDIMKQRQLIRI